MLKLCDPPSSELCDPPLSKVCYLTLLTLCDPLLCDPPLSEMPSESFYQMLEVEQTASFEQIKAAYQRLALTLHPDKAGPGALEHFHALQTAWQVGQGCDHVRTADTSLPPLPLALLDVLHNSSNMLHVHTHCGSHIVTVADKFMSFHIMLYFMSSHVMRTP